MSIDTALFDRLSNHAGLSALVGAGSIARIYPILAPQNVADPYVVYTMISNSAVGALAADTDFEIPRYQVSAWSQNVDTARAVGDQIKDALKRYSGTNDSVVIVDSLYVNRTELLDPDTYFYQNALDFEIWHRA